MAPEVKQRYQQMAVQHRWMNFLFNPPSSCCSCPWSTPDPKKLEGDLKDLESTMDMNNKMKEG